MIFGRGQFFLVYLGSSIEFDCLFLWDNVKWFTFWGQLNLVVFSLEVNSFWFTLLKCFLVAIALLPLKNFDFPLMLITAKLFIPISIPIGLYFFFLQRGRHNNKT